MGFFSWLFRRKKDEYATEVESTEQKLDVIDVVAEDELVKNPQPKKAAKKTVTPKAEPKVEEKAEEPAPVAEEPKEEVKEAVPEVKEEPKPKKKATPKKKAEPKLLFHIYYTSFSLQMLQLAQILQIRYIFACDVIKCSEKGGGGIYANYTSLRLQRIFCFGRVCS